MAKYQHLVRSESDAPAEQDVTSVLASGGFYVIQCTSHGYSTNDVVLLTGFAFNPTVNGVHTITSVINSSRFIIDVAASGSPTTETGFVQLYDISTFTEVYPLGFIETDFDYTRETDKVYFKRTFGATLSFTNRPADGITDYTFFLDIETNDKCAKIDYILKKLCDGVYEEDWRAYFSVTDGEWDKDKCIFKVKPTPDDNIDCMENDVPVNIIDVAAVTTFYNAPTLADRNYTNTRLLNEIIKYIVSQTCSRINGVISDFFQINPENPSTINYVTGEVNPYTEITIGQKIDIKDPPPASLATEAIMTFKELMSSLNAFFNVFWTIENGIVRIEHESYFESQAGLDLTLSPYDKWTKNTNKYSYKKQNAPSEENWTVDENDSIGKIVYDSYCIKNPSTKKYSSGKITSNLILLRGSPDSVKSDEGFVIMATAYNSGTGKYDVLSWANNAFYLFALILKFFRHNRSQLTAEFFYGDTSYGNLFIYSEKKTKKQKDFVIPLCCDDDFSPSDYMTTALGKGDIDNASFRIKSDMLRISLLYGENNLPDIIPSDLSGLALWLKGDDANAPGAISSWTDQSGNGRHAVQATGANQPIKVAGVANNLPVIRFDGTNDSLATSSFIPFPSKRGSLFIVFKCFQPIRVDKDPLVEWSTTSVAAYLDPNSGPTAGVPTTLNRKFIQQSIGSSYINPKIGENIIDTILGYKASDYGYTDFVLFEFIRNDDATVDCYGNGTRKLTSTLANQNQPASAAFRIGTDTVQFLKGDIAEIILYDSALSDYNRQRVELYLFKKYALFPFA